MYLTYHGKMAMFVNQCRRQVYNILLYEKESD